MPAFKLPITHYKLQITQYALQPPATASRFLPDGDMVCINCRHDVEQAGDDDELRAVVRDGDVNGATTQVHDLRGEIKDTGANVAPEAKHVEDVAGVRGVDLALHQDAEREHRQHRDEQQPATYPLLQHQ